jgi:hypothetical protein
VVISWVNPTAVAVTRQTARGGYAAATVADMSQKLIFTGQAVKSEMVLLVLEKWGLHPELREKSEKPNPNDLDRDADVLIPADEFECAKEILFGESEIERAGF